MSGTWQLSVEDFIVADLGGILSWSISLTTDLSVNDAVANADIGNLVYTPAANQAGDNLISSRN